MVVSFGLIKGVNNPFHPPGNSTIIAGFFYLQVSKKTDNSNRLLLYHAKRKLYAWRREQKLPVVGVRLSDLIGQYASSIGQPHIAAMSRGDITLWLLELYKSRSDPGMLKPVPKKTIDPEKLAKKREWELRNEFYTSSEWTALRRLVFKKYSYKCMKCEKTNVEMHVDHIKPRSLYPSLELDFNNLQVLCRKCNKEKSNKNCTDYRPAHLLCPTTTETI